MKSKYPIRGIADSIWISTIESMRDKLGTYIANKKQQCRDCGKRPRKLDRNGNPVEWKLTRNEVEQLLTEAGITIYEVGAGKGKFCLARVNDTGDYELGNARFITNEQNGLEFWNGLSKEEQEARKQRARENGALGAKFGILGGAPTRAY